jgi:hypothetical protein
LWPWAQVLRALGDDRDIVGLVPQRALLDPQVARGQLNRGLTDILRERGQARPLLLVLDDLHWADVASLALLEFFAAHLADVCILVLGTYREVDLPRAPSLIGTLGVLARLPGADRVALQGLDLDVDPASPFSQQELFGPAVAVSTAEDWETAIAQANSTGYGLAAGIFTADVAGAVQAMRAAVAEMTESKTIVLHGWSW